MIIPNFDLVSYIDCQDSSRSGVQYWSHILSCEFARTNSPTVGFVD